MCWLVLPGVRTGLGFEEEIVHRWWGHVILETRLGLLSLSSQVLFLPLGVLSCGRLFHDSEGGGGGGDWEVAVQGRI